MMIDFAVDQLHRVLSAFEIDVLDTVRFQSRIPPCLKCGRHKECEIGGLYQMLGDPAKELTITPEMFNKWEDNEETCTALGAAAEKLKNLPT